MPKNKSKKNKATEENIQLKRVEIDNKREEEVAKVADAIGEVPVNQHADAVEQTVEEDVAAKSVEIVDAFKQPPIVKDIELEVVKVTETSTESGLVEDLKRFAADIKENARVDNTLGIVGSQRAFIDRINTAVSEGLTIPSAISAVNNSGISDGFKGALVVGWQDNDSRDAFSAFMILTMKGGPDNISPSAFKTLLRGKYSTLGTIATSFIENR